MPHFRSAVAGMQNNYDEFEQRKKDHIQLALLDANQTYELNPFDQFHLIHEAIPDFNFDQIDITSSRFSEKTKTPFLVSSMTAGHEHAKTINKNLITACAQKGWSMGVGSQRRELTDDNAGFEWQPLIDQFPEVPLFSNLGIAQIITATLDDIRLLVDTLKAQALIIHCNPLQECIQPEGTPYFKGAWHAIEQLVAHLKLPIIVKETGCGFAKATLQRLNDIGVAAVDVSGVGGTHWGRIEGHRATNDFLRQKAASTFANWGIDTIQSVKNALAIQPRFEIWGSGGVRNGLDAAKLLALGAKTVGFAKPMLQAALTSSEAVCELMDALEYELKVAMFCTGSKNIMELQEKICQ